MQNEERARSRRLRSAFRIHRSAFSFAEVLFAVVVLGIGFIMIVAIFPVAIQQSKATSEETVGAAAARGAVSTFDINSDQTFTFNPPVGTAGYCTGKLLVPTDLAVGASTTAPDLPPFGVSTSATLSIPANSSVTLGKVISLHDPRVINTTTGTALPLASTMWNAFSGSFISTTDPRCAYAVMYRRTRTFTNTGGAAPADTAAPQMMHSDSSVAQLIVICAQVRNRPVYDLRSVQPTTGVFAEIQPKPILVTINDNGGGPGIDTAVFADNKTGIGLIGATGAIAENTYVVISDDLQPPPKTGFFNGHIYKVGVRRPDLGADTWELAPGGDYSPDPGPDGVLKTNDDFDISGQQVQALVVGRGFSDPTTTPTSADQYEGPAQDVSVYTTLLNISP